jgi:hypothetical protein
VPPQAISTSSGWAPTATTSNCGQESAGSVIASTHFNKRLTGGKTKLLSQADGHRDFKVLRSGQQWSEGAFTLSQAAC